MSKISAGAFQKIHVLVVGDVMLDRYWFGHVDRISPEAPVPVVAIEDKQERAGGAANVANNVTALGAHCTLLSVVGDDDAGRDLRRILEATGIQAILATDRDAHTTVKLRVIARNQQLLRADFDTQPNHEVLAECLDDFRNLVQGVDVVVISDYGKGGLVHIASMIEAARSAATPIIIDPKGRDFSRYAGATMVTPNLKELEGVVGELHSDGELDEKAQQLQQQLGLQYLLVTRSERGMNLYRRDGPMLHSPARAREVYDVSGAGDTVTSAFAVAFAAAINDEQILNFANAAAGIVVGKLGTATAEIEEVLQILEERV